MLVVEFLWTKHPVMSKSYTTQNAKLIYTKSSMKNKIKRIVGDFSPEYWLRHL